MVIQFILNRNVKLLRTEAKQIATKADCYSSYGTYSKVKWSRRTKKMRKISKSHEMKHHKFRVQILIIAQQTKGR